MGGCHPRCWTRRHAHLPTGQACTRRGHSHSPTSLPTWSPGRGPGNHSLFHLRCHLSSDTSQNAPTASTLPSPGTLRRPWEPSPITRELQSSLTVSFLPESAQWLFADFHWKQNSPGKLPQAQRNIQFLYVFIFLGAKGIWKFHSYLQQQQGTTSPTPQSRRGVTTRHCSLGKLWWLKKRWDWPATTALVRKQVSAIGLYNTMMWCM